MSLPDRPAWHADAACRGLTGLFFPEQGEDTRAATAICRTCPCQEPCRAAGRTERFGVWGGRSTRQRTNTRRSLVVVPVVPACGTLAAYHVHRRRDEEPCEPCRAVHRESLLADYRGRSAS